MEDPVHILDHRDRTYGDLLGPGHPLVAGEGGDVVHQGIEHVDRTVRPAQRYEGMEGAGLALLPRPHGDDEAVLHPLDVIDGGAHSEPSGSGSPTDASLR